MYIDLLSDFLIVLASESEKIKQVYIDSNMIRNTTHGHEGHLYLLNVIC